MFPMIVALATEVSVIAVNPKIVEMPNNMPGNQTERNSFCLSFCRLCAQSDKEAEAKTELGKTKLN
jgi:hypothetical protein